MSTDWRMTHWSELRYPEAFELDWQIYSTLALVCIIATAHMKFYNMYEGLE